MTKVKKTIYYRVKFKQLFEISEKAVRVDCFDGSSDILPKSQIVFEPFEDAILVPVWLAEQKNIQFAHKKIWKSQ